MIVLLFLGVAIIALGIYSIVHNRKMEKRGRSQARVQVCMQSTMEVMSKTIPCYEIVLEIYTAQGMICRTIRDGQPYEIGQYVDVFYDDQADKVTLAKHVTPSTSKAPWVLIGFGVMIILVGALIILMTISETFAVIGKAVFAYGFVIIFIVVGAYVSIIKPLKNKKLMPDCHKIQGTLVDYREEIGNDNDGVVYTPIYAYYYNGREERLEGSVTGNNSKYRSIGRKVTIVMNDITKEVYCMEDMKEGRNLGIIFMLIGIGIGVIMVCHDFFGMFGG